MSHSHSSWSDLPPFLLLQRLSNVLLSSDSDEQLFDPRTAGRPGRLAIRCPVTGCEPKTTVEITGTSLPHESDV